MHLLPNCPRYHCFFWERRLQSQHRTGSFSHPVVNNCNGWNSYRKIRSFAELHEPKYQNSCYPSKDSYGARSCATSFHQLHWFYIYTSVLHALASCSDQQLKIPSIQANNPVNSQTNCCTKCLPDNNRFQNSPLKAGLVRDGTGHSTQHCPVPVTRHMPKGTSVFCLCLRRLQEWPTYTDIRSTALFSNIFSYCCGQQTRACHTPGSVLTGVWVLLSRVPGPAEGAQARSWCLHWELQQLTPRFS